MMYELKGPWMLGYFKAWGHGRELELYIENGDIDSTTLEEHLPGQMVYAFEGQTAGGVILSDVLESGRPSDKHHYFIDEAEFEAVFVEV
jgi:hypothetical protein